MPRYFPVTRTKTVTVEVPVGDGDRDVSYNESIDLGEQLAGTLGPVQTDDSIDLTAAPVLDDLYLADSADMPDDLRQVVGPFVGESADISEALAGTLGPIQTQDSIDVTADPDIGPLVVQESADASDAPGMPDITAQAQESVDITARLGNITQLQDDDGKVADALAPVDLRADDSADASDQFGAITGLVFGEMLDATDITEPSITATQPDTLDGADTLRALSQQSDDSAAASTARGTGTITTARIWPNAQISNSGFTNPGNWIDLTEGSNITLSASQSGGLLGGSSATVNGDLIVDCGNVNFAPDITITNALVQFTYAASANQLLQTGNAVNIAIQYSLNNGSSWTTALTVNAPGQTGTGSVAIGITEAQLNQLRFRAVGSVTSGTIAIVGGATQSFTSGYIRLQFNATQPPP